MLIARKKYTENIVEYILYMWQVEDLLRAYNFDMELVRHGIIDKHTVPDEVKYEMQAWYQRIIDEMMREGLSEKGHIAQVRNAMMEVQHLHLQLLTVWQDTAYKSTYEAASPHIQELYKKTSGMVVHETEVCLNALYGILLLKLKNTPISRATLDAIKDISEMMAYIAAKHQAYKKGELGISTIKRN